MTRALLQTGQLPEELQEQMSALFLCGPDGRARPGLIPRPGYLPALRQTPTAGPTVDIANSACVVNGTGTTSGDFLYAWDDHNMDVLGAHPAGTMPRVDIVGVRVKATAGAENTDVVVVNGTPASNPVAPATGESFYPLFRIDVPAGAKAITDSMITRLWQYTALRGSALIVFSSTDRQQLSPSYLMPGQEVWTISERRRDYWDGVKWVLTDTGWADLALYNNWTVNASSFQAPQFRIKNGVAYFRGAIKPTFIAAGTTWSGTATGTNFLTVPANAQQAGVTGPILYSTMAGTVDSSYGAMYRVMYRVETDGTHRLWLQDPTRNGASPVMSSTSGWVNLSDLSWPVG